MKHSIRQTLTLLFLFVSVAASAQDSTAFARYFAAAQQFANDYPQEKVYLHFDNNSYYQGDSIWFKAYVVTARDNKPTMLSKPLYVDLIDQLGNVVDRQIIPITNGVGSGYFSLAKAFFTGYYEVRAYTKWMLAFDNPTYFSRTLPVYRKRLNKDEASRSIAKYSMDQTMKQRPTEKIKSLTARFYPEGGRLVKGIPSIVGFETVSADSGWVNVQGYLLSPGGERQTPVATIHDGMGSFLYTPGDKPARVELLFGGKSYKFDLPDADADGYTLHVKSGKDDCEVTVAHGAATPAEPLALFLYSRGTPCAYSPVHFDGAASATIRMNTADLPAGLIRISLINAKGATLNDRFSFVYPADTLHLSGSADSQIYAPLKHATVKVKLTDAAGNPIPDADLSVAVRDGNDFDYRKDADNVLTDLLLTSELKGFIPRPAYYLGNTSPARRHTLDNLLIIRGWRQYDLATTFDAANFKPKYKPEQQLNLYGQVKSLYDKPQPGIDVSVMSLRDDIFLAGSVKADSLGRFALPINSFQGWLETLIQTHRDKKTYNRNSYIYLDRNFEPELRAYDIEELSPHWDMPKNITLVNHAIEEQEQAQMDKDAIRLGEVEVKAKRLKAHSLLETKTFERRIVGFYNVRRYMELQRDKGQPPASSIPELLHELNSNIQLHTAERTSTGVNAAFDNDYSKTMMASHVKSQTTLDKQSTTTTTSEFTTMDDSVAMVYQGAPVYISLNGRESNYELQQGVTDMIDYATLYWDFAGRVTSKSFDEDMRATESRNKELSTDLNTRTPDQISAGSALRCDFTMAKDWRSDANYTPTHGIRKTYIQGYEIPATCYSPIYGNDVESEFIVDNRRTLYWNPNVKTDANGEATIECSNARSTTFLDVSAETLHDGKPAAIEFSSY
jgi:hypothetical protein